MPLREDSFNAGPVTIHYAASDNDGPPIVLLHGITNRWQAFLNMMPALAQQWRVFALDLRGHGRSGHVQGGYRGELMSEDVIRFIEERAGGPVVLYGHSLGGFITTYIASHRPELVRAVCLADSPIFFDTLHASVYPEMFAKVHELIVAGIGIRQLVVELQDMQLTHPAFGTVKLKTLPFHDESYLRWWARSLMMMDPEALAMAVDGRLSENWDPEFIRKVACPMLLIQADPKFGGLVTARDVEACRASIADTVHVLLKDVGHSLNIHQPGPVLRALLNFLGSLD